MNVINFELQKAARAYTQPVNGQVSMVYGDYHYRVDQERKWGKEAWEEACNKARMEYNFGSNAVRW